ILIGVDDDGSVVGVGMGRRTLEELSNNIAQSTDPKVFPEINVDMVGDKYIMKIRVSEHRDKPVLRRM
ncbi:MAG: ATP-binding protein, partial [Candidatus Methanomethylicia archaeon]